MRSLLSEPPFCKRTALLAAAYLFCLRKIYQASIPMNFFLLIYNCILGETLFACIPDDDLISQINLDDFLHSMLYHSINELGQKCRRNICPFIQNATSHKYQASTCHQLLSFNKKIEYLCAKDNPVP